jgi:hypothetical protein
LSVPGGEYRWYLAAMLRPPRTLILPAAFALALSLLGSGLHLECALAATRGRDVAEARHHASHPPEVTLGPIMSGPSTSVTMSPVGLSLEYPVMAAALATSACPSPALVAQLRALGSPPLALAGESQDLTIPSGVAPAPPLSWESATLYPLPANFWSQLHCLLSAAGDQLTAGINAKTGNLSWAQQMVAGATAAAAGVNFSLGNEPDLYYLPNYSSLAKPQANEEAAAVNLYLQVASYLRQALGGASVIGPELATPAHWQHALPQIIAQLHEQAVGVHLYPLSTCVTPRAATIGGLLSARAADSPHRLAWVVADANAAGIPAVISEANSVSCGGEEGVSDSPASAVWAIRFVLAALETGFREVRFHFSGGPYDPFIVRGEEVLARPLDSALIALDQWLPIGSSLQRVAGVRKLVTTRVAASPASAAGAAQLILDNEHAQAQRVVLRGANSVRIEVLSARSAGAQTTELSSPRDRIKLVVAGNSVVAVLAAPAAAAVPAPAGEPAA